MKLALNPIVVSLFCFESAIAQDDLREWVDDTGRHKTRAELVKVHEDKVELRLENGENRTVPIVRLSMADVAYLRDRALQQDNPQAPTAIQDRPAKIINVELDLGQPRIADKNTVHFLGTTNLPAGTKLIIRCELPSSPSLFNQNGQRKAISTSYPTIYLKDVVVAINGTFRFTLKDRNGFKTGQHRLFAQVDVFHTEGTPLNVSGETTEVRPQPPYFYRVAGDFGENLTGPAVDRKSTFFKVRQVEVNVDEEYELSDGTIDEIARLEKTLLKTCSRALDDAFTMHEQKVRNNLPEFDYDFAYSQRLRNFRSVYYRVRALEAFHLIAESTEALDRMHYFAQIPTHQIVGNPARAAEIEAQRVNNLANAVTDYKTAKAKLDEFIDGIQ